MQIGIAIHGGAGNISHPQSKEEREEIQLIKDSLKSIITTGYNILKDRNSSIEAVEHCVTLLENDPHFNAGKGSVYNYEGRHYLEATIAEGFITPQNGKEVIRCGAITEVNFIKNPIKLANVIMQYSPHHLISGYYLNDSNNQNSGSSCEFLERLIHEHRIETVPKEYFNTQKRYQQWQEYIKKHPLETNISLKENNLNFSGISTNFAIKTEARMETVGAVDLDLSGHLVAGTSTGGRTGKWPGRIGDSAIHGCGNYANSMVAISGTGNGDCFIKNNIAFDIAARVKYIPNMTLAKAAHEVIHNSMLPAESAGVISIDREGNVVMEKNTPGMFRASVDCNGLGTISIWNEVDNFSL